MARLVCLSVVALGLAMTSTASIAQNLSGNDLLATCEATDDLAKSGFCIGYVNGVIEGMKWGIAAPLLMGGQTIAEAENATGVLLGFCNPEGATLRQLVDVVVVYLRNHPAERHNSARIQVQLALTDAYPCE